MDYYQGEFSNQEMKDLREAFSLFDKNADGHISKEEICCVLTTLRIKSSEQEIIDMIKRVDVDGDGMIDFEEFLEMMEGLKQRQSYDEQFRETFNVFDINGDGFIEAWEVKEAMASLGENISDKDADAMIKEVDANRDGRINFHEFVKMMQCWLHSSVGETLEKDKFTDEQLAELKLAFSLFDKDKDGNISMSEVRSVMAALGLHPKETEFQSIFNQVDLDGNGLIDFEEFTRMIESRMERKPADVEIRAMFRSFDKDNSGFIDASELRRTMQEVGIVLSDADVRDMMKEAGVGSHGRIYYEDFLRMMSGSIGEQSRKNEEMNNHQNSVEDKLELEEMRVAFALFDKDGDGKITSKELLSVMQSLGVDTSTATVQKMIEKVDIDGNGTIEFDEFKKYMKKRKGMNFIYKKHKTSEEAEMRQAFSVFDKDGNGYIEPSEVQSTMRELGIKLSNEDVSAMMKAAGVEEDGRIFYEDFVNIMCGHEIKKVPQLSIVENTGGFSSTLSNEQVAELEVAFSLFDKDGDGAITTEELRSVMQKIGFDPDDKEVRRMIKRFDFDRNGKLDFEEFLRMMTRRKRGKTIWSRTKIAEPEAWRAFKVFDKDRNGYIDSVELKDTMRDLGVELSDSDIAAMIKEADIDGDGKINYQEFIKIMKDFIPFTIAPTTDSMTAHHTECSIPEETTSSPYPAKPPLRSVHSAPTFIQCNDIAAKFKTAASLIRKQSTTDASRKCNAAFRLFDKDNDGQINIDEMEQAMKFLSFPYTKSQLMNMSSKFASDGSGTIDLHEFLGMIEKCKEYHKRTNDHRRQVKEEEMRKAFKVFDIDGNGLIDADELKVTMTYLGQMLSEDDVTAMMKAADLNGDGRIDYEEFIRMVYAE